MKKCISLSFILLPALLANAINVTQVWSTEGDYYQVKEYEAELKEVPASPFSDTEWVFHINQDESYQQIDGFGAAFSELGWQAISALSGEDRQSIINELFSEDGCAFTICRIPIGANDFSLNWYSLSPVPNDYGMEHFSMEREHQGHIPFIKLAMQVQPGLEVWASPWSPPDWMKESGYYGCRGANDFDDPVYGQCCTELKEQSVIKDDAQTLTAYALYFARFVEEYREAGINLNAVHVQNEPVACQLFPSCLWTPELLTSFTAGYLIPTFEQRGLECEVWMGTLNTADKAYADIPMENEVLQEKLTGFGFQWAGKDLIGHVYENYPDMKLMQTESECNNGHNDWLTAMHTWELLNHYFNHGANSYLYWNMVLDHWGFSTWTWRQNSLVSVNRHSGEYSYNPDFYMMKHFSANVQPGAIRIDTGNESPLATAFENPDGSIVLQLANNTEKSKTAKIRIENEYFDAKIEGMSVNTFIISKL